MKFLGRVNRLIPYKGIKRSSASLLNGLERILDLA